MKKFVLVPYAQFQQDKSRAAEIGDKARKQAEEPLEKEQVAPSRQVAEHSPPEDRQVEQEDIVPRAEETQPAAAAPAVVNQDKGNKRERETTTQPESQPSERKQGAEGLKTPQVKRKRQRRTDTRKITPPPPVPPQKPVQPDKDDGQLPPVPPKKFWLRP